MLIKPNIFAASLALAMTTATAADASVVMNFTESGGNVDLTVSGNFDTTGGDFNTGSGPFDSANTAVRGSGLAGVLTGADYNFYQFVVIGPSSIGPGVSNFFGDTGTGDVFLFNWSTGNVGLALDYASGSALSGSGSFSSTTISALGLTEGNYVWEFSNGEQVTININSDLPEVPLPAGGILLLSGLAAIGLKRHNART